MTLRIGVAAALAVAIVPLTASAAMSPIVSAKLSGKQEAPPSRT